jgi:hypothetical protein
MGNVEEDLKRSGIDNRTTKGAKRSLAVPIKAGTWLYYQYELMS